MATAGRILIIPKGDYNASTTYEMLDLVSHGGSSWLAKKTCVGITPGNDTTEYWHNMFDIAVDDFDQVKADLDKLRDLIVFETIFIEQTFNFMYVEPKLGYHLLTAMVTTFENGDSDLIDGLVWQDSKYVLITKAAPTTPTTKRVMLTWVRTE